MSGRTRTIVIIVVALGIAVASSFFLKSGDPHVEVAAEKLFSIGGFPVTNAFFTALIVDVILVTLAFLATRNMQMVPRGVQNVFELILEALYNLFKNISPKFINVAFPLVATIFLFVLFSNWIGLLPGGSSIGPCIVKEATRVWPWYATARAPARSGCSRRASTTATRTTPARTRHRWCRCCARRAQT